MADNASIELALERAVEDTVAAGGAAWIVLAPLPQARRVFQDAGASRLLDEMSSLASVPDDEQVLMVIVRAPGAEENTVLGAAVTRPPPNRGGGDDAYRGGGFGALPASAAAVAELKKAAFRIHAAAGGDGAVKKGCSCGGGGVTGCAVCLEEFEDGEEVAEMPCRRGHGFHPGCITEWLGCSNMCPLCRHPLPTSCGDDVDQ